MSSNTATAYATSDGSDEQTPGTFSYSIGISFGILLLLIVIAYCSYLYKRHCTANNTNRNRLVRGNTTATATTDDDDSGGIPEAGLHEETLRTYPKLLYSQAKNHELGGDYDQSCTASGCSICLQDYKDTDVLRLLPECGHFFHLKCVDPWLKIHPTCPVCRNSPIPSPLDGPVLEIPRLSSR